MKRNNIWMLTDAAGNGTRLRYRNSHTLARAARLRELERFINDVLGLSASSLLQHRMVAAHLFGINAVERIWKPQQSIGPVDFERDELYASTAPDDRIAMKKRTGSPWNESW